MEAWLIACAFAVAASAVLTAVYIYLVRPWHLTWGATDEEVVARLPGDELVPRPKTEATHAVTIRAPGDRVWPYLVQLGQDRAGFYSYTWLENLVGCHMRNTYRVVPEWQHLAAGDGVLFHPKMPRGPVAVLDPGQALVIGGPLDPDTGAPVAAGSGDPDRCGATAWAFVLRDLGEGRTRLVVRLRGRWPDGWRGWAVNRLFWEPAHFVMERKMLLTLKRLAEAGGEPAHPGREPAAAH